MRLRGNRRARWIALALTLVTLGVMGFLAYRRVVTLYQNIGPLLVERLQQQLGREVAIGRVDASRPGRVVLERVAVAEKQRIAEGTLLRSPRVVVFYRPFELIWGSHDVMAAISTILVESPTALIERDAKGQWNVLQLFRPQRPAGPMRFRGRVEVRGGRLTLRDYMARGTPVPAVNQVRSLDGFLAFAGYPEIAAEAAGAAEGRRAGRLRSTFYLRTDAARWLLTVGIRDLDAAYWSHYLFAFPLGQIRSGRADLELTMSREGRGPANPLRFVVVGNGRNATITSPRLGQPIRSAQVSFQADTSGLSLNGTGEAAGMRVRVAGRLIGWRQSRLALQGGAEGVTLAAVRRVFPTLPPPPKGVALPGPASFTAIVNGAAANPVIFGTAAMPALAVSGTRLADVRADWRYFARRLQVTRATARGAQGVVDASGWVDLSTRPVGVYATGTVKHLALEALPWDRPGARPPQRGPPRPRSLPSLQRMGVFHPAQTRGRVAGRLDGAFVVSGTSGRLNGVMSAQGTGLRMGGRRVEQAMARLSLTDGRVHVERLVLNDPKGTLIAWGDVSPQGRIAAHVRAIGVDLRRWLAAGRPAEIQGTAYFTGDLTGTTSDPRLSGNLELYEGRMGEFEVDYGHGHVVASKHAITFDPQEGFEAHLYPAALIVRGEIREPAGGSPQLDLTASLRGLGLARLLARDGEEPVATGVASGTVAVRGTPRAPTGAGQLTVEYAAIRGVELGTVTADARLGEGRLTISDLRTTGGGVEIRGEGTVGLVAPAGARSVATLTRASPVRLALSITGFDLGRLNVQTAPYADLSGTASLPEIAVSGTLGRPVVTGQLTVGPLKVNGQPITRLAGALFWDGERVRLTDTTLAVGDGQVRIPEASYHLPERDSARSGEWETLAGSFTTLPVSLLLGMVRNSGYLGTREGLPLLRTVSRIPGNVDGQLTGSFQVTPGVPEPRMTVELAPSELNFPSVHLPEEVPASGVTPTPAVAAAAAAKRPPLLTLNLQGAASYQAKRLRIDRFQMTRSGDAEAQLTANGEFLLAGARDISGTPVKEGRIDSFALHAINMPLSLAGVALPALPSLAGRGDIQILGAGSLRAPVIEASASADNPVIGGIPFTRLDIARITLTADADGIGHVRIYRGRLLREHGEHSHQVLVETGDGEIPVALSPLDDVEDLPRRERLERMPRRLQVAFESSSLDLLEDAAAVKNPDPRIAPVVATLQKLGHMRGKATAMVTLAGSRAVPANSGEIRVEGLGFTLPGGQTDLQNINARLAFAGDELRIVPFTDGGEAAVVGASSRGGQFKITGLARLGRVGAAQGQLDLALRVDDLKIVGRNLTGLLDESVTATFRTASAAAPFAPAPIHITGSLREPLVSGSNGARGGILVRDATLGLPAALPAMPERAGRPPVDPQFRLAIIAGDRVWIRNPRLMVEVQGTLPVNGDLAQPSIRGTLRVQRGTLRFPTATFRLTGTIAVAYAPGPEGGVAAAPIQVDLNAASVVRGISPTSGRMQRYDVTLHIYGALTSEPVRLTGLEEEGVPEAIRARLGSGSLHFETRSNPGLTQTQILALLGRQSAVEGILAGRSNIQDVFRQEFEQVLGSALVPSLLASTEYRIAEALGLEEFSVEFAFHEPLRVRIGKRLAGKFYTTYVQTLTNPGVPASTLSVTPARSSLEFYYKLSDRLRAGYRLDEPGRRGALLLEGSFRF